ncbi:MAG: flagellar biosynthetic protein FliR [Pseudomonadota bacterium]
MGFDWVTALGASAPAPGFLLLVFLLSLRLGAMLLLTPILTAGAVPGPVRGLIVVGLAVALALGLPPLEAGDTAALSQLGPLLTAAASELALGALLALGIFIAFAAISMAGRLIDVQIGFGIAQVFDPVTRRQIPVLTSAFNQLAVLVFFLADAHHALLRGVAYTLERFPPGRPWPVQDAAPLVAKQMAGLFSLGFALAAPVVVCLLLIELALGVVSRNLPQINMFVIGVPVKIVVGLGLLALWFAGMGDSMTRIYGFIFRGWQAAFAVPGVR